MKICIKCNEDPVRRKGVSYCKKCHNEYQKAYYKKNPRSINASCVRRRNDIRQLVIKSKSIPCVDCGKSYPYYVMDLDHLPNTNKKFMLSIAASKMRSIDSIKEEISKCEVVCANCHRERTFSRMNNSSLEQQ
jgi:hypothetical protein